MRHCCVAPPLTADCGCGTPVAPRVSNQARALIHGGSLLLCVSAALAFFGGARGYCSEEKCGIAAVSAICVALGYDLSDEDRASLRAALVGDSVSLLQVRRAAESVGVSLVAVRATMQELLAIPGPKIVQVKDPDHFLVLLRSSENWLQFVDAARVVVVPREEFEQRYGGYALIYQHPSEGDGPQAQLEEFHCLTTATGVREQVRQSFSVRNAGNQPLVLGLTPGGCGGAVAASVGQDVLQPGDTTDVTLEFEVPHTGRVMKLATLITNDPLQPIIHLPVQVSIPHDVRVSPNELAIATEKSDVNTLRAWVTVSGPLDMAVTEALCTQGIFRPIVGDPSVRPDGRKAWRVDLHPNGPSFVGERRDQLVIKTTNEERPVVTVPIRWHIRSDLAISPASAFAGFASLGESTDASVFLLTRSRTPFRLLGITPSDPRIEVTQSETEGGYSLAVSVPTDKLGVFEGEVVVTTDIPLEETISIPVYVHVVE